MKFKVISSKFTEEIAVENRKTRHRKTHMKAKTNLKNMALRTSYLRNHMRVWKSSAECCIKHFQTLTSLYT